MRRAAALSALAVAALAPASASAGPLDKDYAAYARNIIPSGQFGSIPIPDGASTQAQMYDALTPRFDGVTDADLLTDFKSEVFGVGPDGPGRVERVPRKGVKITRDKYNVPHVRATTYDSGVWASGWIAAEDRGLLMQQARNNARVAAIDAPGLDALGLIAGLKSFVPSAETEAVVAKQTKVLKQAGKPGRRVLHDIDTYLAGVNAYFKKNGGGEPFTRNDIYAVMALKGQFVGQGGGGEARRTQFFSSLRARLGEPAALGVFNDLRQHDDPEMPASITKTFPYAPLPATRAGNVIIDPGSYEAVSSLADGRTVTRAKQQASNVLMVGAKQSATGRPLMVGGPQIGYFYPGLTFEIDMHAPGLVWRGATVPAFPGYMLIGRGPDFATTLTSAGGDIIDQYAETLCEGSDTKYLYKGTCRDMTLFNAGTLDGKAVSFQQTVHGPVVGYATVNGVKVAISSKRSSRGRDSLDLLFYRDVSAGAVKSPKTFFRAAAKSPQTFNSFYIDHKNIAVFTSGRLPIRADSVDNGLLTNGEGGYEWKGFLSAAEHPQQSNPSTGRIVNWNNNIAKGFGAADDEWMRAGAVSRVDLLNKNLARLAVGGKQTLATMTSAMNAAATQDVRAIDTMPLLTRLLAGTTAPSARAQKMLDLMSTWADGGAGGSRLDSDLDGKVDDPGAAVMDAAWEKIADAFMAPVLGPDLAELATLESRHSLSQYTGWYQYFDKDIRRLLGDSVAGQFSNQYCGAGVKTTCQSAVWAAIDAAGAAMEARTGNADPAAWRADATAERIEFVPGLLPTTIRWTNRPSGIQQVISFKGHR
jgi:acyl-homoserine lactone acylase PvdQ